MAAVWAIVVAAGDGRRFGRLKQFEPLGCHLVVEWSVAAARSVADGVVLVLPSAYLDRPEVHAGADLVVAGGATRTESVRAGLDVVPSEASVVVVHDATRPFASEALFERVVTAVLEGAAGAIPGVAVTDTVKRVADGQVVETLERTELVAVQTPQAFSVESIREAHRLGEEATDDAALLERLGVKVIVVEGEATNRKLTDADDLVIFERLLAERQPK